MKPLQQLTAADVIEFLKSVDKKTWVQVGIGVIVLIALWSLILEPAWIERFQLKSQIKSIQGQIQTVVTLNQKKALWDRQQKEFSELIDKTRVRLFQKEEVSLLLGQVSKLARDAKVNVIASKPQGEKSGFPAPYDSQYQGSSYDFAVEGGYHDLGRFTSLVESYPKLLRIQSLKIMPIDKTPEKQIAELRIMAVSTQKKGPAA